MRRNSKTAGPSDSHSENFFWIAFSDLLLSVATLFLILLAMVQTSSQTILTENTKTISATTNRTTEIATCLTAIKKSLAATPEITLRNNVIDFGPTVLFAEKQHRFENEAQATSNLRTTVSSVLQATQSATCSPWVYRIIVDGYASKTGNYLFNLNLSYLRSQRVLCSLLDTTTSNPLPSSERQLVQSLFMTGASSFNTSESDGNARMRRIELRIDFLNTKNTQPPLSSPTDIPLDPGLKCPNGD